MAYTISLSNGTSLLGTTGLPAGTIDTTSTSLALIGKNYPGYGVFMNENFVKLIENFSNTSAPSSPLPGQIWYDSGTRLLKVNIASAAGSDPTWRILAGITSSTAPNSAPVVGEFWWDTANAQLKIYSGVLSQGDAVNPGWITVGPVSNSTTGLSGAQPDTISDGSVAHTVIKFYVANDLAAILSKDADFIPATPITGFAVIRPGLNLSSGLTNQLQYYGNANVAMNLMVSGNVVSASSFARTDVVTTSTVPIVTTSNIGITIGTQQTIVANVNPSGTISSISTGFFNNDNNRDTVFYVKTSGVTSAVLKLNGANAKAEVYTDPTTSLGIATKQYVDAKTGAVGTGALARDGSNAIIGNIAPNANVTYNLGSATAWFNNIYGRSYQAAYADLAERFESDLAYEAGTVVELGGDKEITAVKDDLSETVFGVISTQAAFVMNAQAGTNVTHPAVAVNGRVPVNVTGIIKKGDRLVSAGNGLARAASKSELTAFNVIGRALEHKTTTGPGIIQAIVRLNS